MTQEGVYTVRTALETDYGSVYQYNNLISPNILPDMLHELYALHYNPGNKAVPQQHFGTRMFTTHNRGKIPPNQSLYWSKGLRWSINSLDDVPYLKWFLEFINQQLGTQFNRILVRKYRNGQDYTTETMNNDCLENSDTSQGYRVVFVFGHPRRIAVSAKPENMQPTQFQKQPLETLIPKRIDKQYKTLPIIMDNGSGVIFAGPFCHYYRYSIPKETRVTLPTWTVTFLK